MSEPGAFLRSASSARARTRREAQVLLGGSGAAFFLVTFSWPNKKKRPACGAEAALSFSSIAAGDSHYTLDPGFRRDDEREVGACNAPYPFASFSNTFSIARMSSGIGVSHSTLLPVTGCTNPSRAACSA